MIRRLSRRDLIKRFGVLGFALTPIARAMGYIAGGPFSSAPRYVMFFVGGALHPSKTQPPTLSAADLAGTTIEPLIPHAQDIILFKNMRIHGGQPYSEGYTEEHGAGLIGTTTGNIVRYTANDSYFAYTDHESLDIAIGNHYAVTPGVSALPFSGLQLGAGAHSDADNVGLGQRYVSWRNRVAGDTTYGNAYEPTQNAGLVYDQLMARVSILCGMPPPAPVAPAGGAGGSGGAPTTTDPYAAQRAALTRRKSLVDFHLADLTAAKNFLGVDSAYSLKLDGMVQGWRDAEALADAQIAAIPAPGDGGTGGGTTGTGGGTATAQACPTIARPTGNGQNQLDGDLLEPVHTDMVAMMKMAFEWDLTRVIAYTLSGASDGQRLPSRGVTKAHHTLEHSNDVAGQLIMGVWYMEQLAKLLVALKSIDDGGGMTALNNTSIIVGMECWSNSSSGHYLTNIPFLFAGQGGGKFTTGRIVDAANRNINDVMISVQNACGITATTFGAAQLCAGPII